MKNNALVTNPNRVEPSSAETMGPGLHLLTNQELKNSALAMVPNAAVNYMFFRYKHVFIHSVAWIEVNL